MRWFARRLGFYVFAIWVALTINFLLPRLMPGDPVSGLLAPWYGEGLEDPRADEALPDKRRNSRNHDIRRR